MLDIISTLILHLSIDEQEELVIIPQIGLTLTSQMLILKLLRIPLMNLLYIISMEFPMMPLLVLDFQLRKLQKDSALVMVDFWKPTKVPNPI